MFFQAVEGNYIYIHIVFQIKVDPCTQDDSEIEEVAMQCMEIVDSGDGSDDDLDVIG